MLLLTSTEPKVFPQATAVHTRFHATDDNEVIITLQESDEKKEAD
jgi:hypothetical protein